MHQQSLNRGLLKAIRTNDAARVHTLLVHGADANARSDSAERTTIIQDLQAFVASVQHKSPRQKRGMPALELLLSGLVRSQFTNVLKSPANLSIAVDLIRHGADINVLGEYGDTPLSVAAGYGDFDYVRLLLENGANPNLYSLGDGAPLISLVTNSWQRGCPQTAIVKLLLQKGAIVNVQNSIGESPLTNAIGAADIELSSLLRSRGANPNTRDRDGNTPLMNLIHAGYLFDSAPSPVIKFMLNNGADVNLQNTKGDSPIAYAVIAGDVSLLRELLARGANPNTRDKRGMSPYGIALLQNGGRYTKEQRRDILALLKRCGAKP